jgi:TonB-linked SusC/RagA family outer membrane protein
MKKQKISFRLSNKVFTTLLCISLFLNIQILNAQNQKINVAGVVKDGSSEPIIGASIVEKGTKNGTITDIEGNFTLTVAADGTLVVSYIGYKPQEVAVNGKSSVSILMKEDTEMLDEVVVVEYGVQKKSDVTGSVTSVPKDRLGKLPVTNVLQAVQGAAAGVTITQTSSIPGDAPDALIRGRNSINASSGPYVVVDGVPISKSGGTLNDINPNDIESMEILKDASATAIYGTNGANGVILITTKRGSTGKPTIRYNGYIGFEDFTNKLDFCNGEQIIQRYKDYVDQNPGETLFDGYVKNQYESDNYKNGITSDWVGAVSQTGLIQNHNVSITGGAENVKYYVSTDYIDQKGIIKGFNYKRYSVRTNLDMNVTDYLTVGTNTYVVSHNRDGGRANLLVAEAMSPYARMYEEDGSYCINPMYSETLFTNPLMWTTTDPERRQWNLNVNGYAEMDFGKLIKPFGRNLSVACRSPLPSGRYFGIRRRHQCTPQPCI